MVDIHAFAAWVREKPPGRRTVKITIGKRDSYEPVVWVYDYDLMAGQFVCSVEEIDLTSEIRADLSHYLRKAVHILTPAELRAVLTECGLDGEAGT